jgi:ApaG protein
MADKKYEVAVAARSMFIPDQSDPQNGRYVFAYTITITNSGNIAAQLLSRHWIISDADNQVQEVRGAGVVGEQPFLRPGESFEYTSGAAIATPVGTMRGTYQMVAEDGVKFDATIPEFTLSAPRILHWACSKAIRWFWFRRLTLRRIRRVGRRNCACRAAGAAMSTRR